MSADSVYLIHHDYDNGNELVICFGFPQGVGHWMLCGLPKLFAPAAIRPAAFAKTQQGKLVALAETFISNSRSSMSKRDTWRATYSLVREANSKHERAEPNSMFKLK